jgi:FkbM family methyltransferase
MIDAGLIYDVGAHYGDDTAWYLELGYRVVAVEANPELAKELEKKFIHAVRDKKLTVVNVAITEKDNETVPFYISQVVCRSSAKKYLAERDGNLAQTIDVATTRLSTLFEKYGTPYYCKIDIEGNDAIAINSLAGKAECPSHISCEHGYHTIAETHTNRNQLFETLKTLQAAGYTSFQLIDQDSLLPLTSEKHYSRIHTLHSRVMTKLELITGLYSSRYNNRRRLARERKMRYDYLTAPFGEMLPDNWADYETTRKYIEFHFNDYYVHTQNKELIFWVDIHARS